MLAPNVAPSAGTTGSTPAAPAIEITTGTIMLAEAVFEVVSERMMATAEKPVTMSSHHGTHQALRYMKDAGISTRTSTAAIWRPVS